MKKILLTNKYTGTPLQIVENEIPEGFEILFLKEQTQDSLLSQIDNIDYILAGGRIEITREVLDQAKSLKMIQRSGVGLDALDLEAIREKKIPLYVNMGINAESVAEYTLLLMLSCLRKLPTINNNTKNGVWKKQEQGVQTRELRGRTVGIIGMGNIAQTLVCLLKPFNVNILYYDLCQKQKDYEIANNMQYVSIDELLENSDIVTIHCSLNEQTKCLINSKTIQLMKDNTILINTARGGIVDIDALAEALKSRKLAYAALDVHSEEPIGDDYPLKEIENVILTPHIGGVTYDSFRMMMRDAFRNIERFDAGDLESISSYKYL